MPFVTSFCLFLALFLQQQAFCITLILDPAAHKGRVIDGTYERGITLQLAEQIKKIIEFKDPQCKVYISRTPNQTIEPLQIAQIANRLNTTLFIHIACFQETAIKPTLSIYYTLWHPVTDFWQEPSPFLFVPINDAYKKSLKTTQQLAFFMKELFEKENHFLCKGAFGIPIAPLIGIQSPALIIELGLRNQHDWRAFIEPICNALIQVLHS